MPCTGRSLVFVVVDVAVDPTEVGLVGERGPDNRQAFVVAFYRKSSATTAAQSAGRRRRSADAGGSSTRKNGQAPTSKRHRYPSADRPATAWSYHGLCNSLTFNAHSLLVAKRQLQCHVEWYEVGTLAVDGWAVTVGTARRGLGGLRPRSVPSSLYQM